MPDTFIKYAQQRTLDNGGSLVTLTPDDILTLKLLHDSWLRMAYVDTDLHQPCLRKSDINETLERILKQVS